MSSVRSEKPESSHADLEGEHASKFRVIGYVLQAVKKFKGALNPGMTFGKRGASFSEEMKDVEGDGERQRMMSVQSRRMSSWTSTRLSTTEGPLKRLGTRKLTSYLLQPLPPVQ